MTGNRVTEKRLRMTLDFEVVVEELTDETLRAHYRESSNFEELVGDREFWANATRQIRLQRALLEDEEVLRRYLTYVVAVEVDPSSDSRVVEVFGVGGERAEGDIFGPLFSRLGGDDERFYRELSEGGVLYDNVEALSRSFRVSCVGARLEEVIGVAKGRVSGESDNLM
jgi:hypothetical protein